MFKTVVIIFAVILAAFFGFGYLSSHLMEIAASDLFGSTMNRIANA